MKLTHASLFSGIGGIDLAVEAAGFQTCAQVEVNPFVNPSSASDSLMQSSSETSEKSGGGDILKACGGSPTVLSGGFPCQPVSWAGNRKGSADSRWLWPEYFRLIRECRPSWIVAENVAALFHIPEYSEICADLKKADYSFEAYVLRAADAGAPHLRARAFVVAHSNCISRHKENPPSCALRSETERREKGSRDDALWGIRAQIPLPDWSLYPPRICRMDDGFSRKVDKSRLQALGNAVVPRCVFPIFDAIRRIEQEEY